MSLCRVGVVSVLVLMSIPATVLGQSHVEQAQERLDYLIGTWDSTTEILDDEGNVIRTDHSVDLIEPFIGTKVLLTTVVGSGPVRKTIRFYDQAEQRYYEIGVGEAGDVWILTGGLDEYVTTSQVRTARDGSDVMVRFTHNKIQPNSFEAVMEVSRDGGESWTPGRSRQRLVRRVSAPS